MKKWLKPLMIVLGLVAFAAVVWFAGPFIGFGEAHPFESVLVRSLVIAVAVFLIGGLYAYGWWKRRKAAQALEEAVAEPVDSEGDMLAGRMNDALTTLKQASGKRGYLYELPWYVIIGPPGAGKTTALVNSGLKFPLRTGSGPMAIEGVGGTRYCDWWFTDEAVLIDTAGRYTTQDSDASRDAKGWLSFLRLLKRNRPKQPINGAIVAISLKDLMTLSNSEIAEHANAIRKRLLELHSELKVDFPVYALFTMADLVPGFMEYFGNFSESRRRKVWGATFQGEDRKRNRVGEVASEFDALVHRLTEELTDRLQEEADPAARAAIFGFPSQFAALREKVAGFLAEIFEPNRYQTNAALRGFYFSSGTQEGTPIDQLLGRMATELNMTSAHQRAMSSKGRSFFLHDLMRSVIFEESGLVSSDRSAVRRSMLLHNGALALVALLTAGMVGLWWWSFSSNRALIDNVDVAANDFRAAAEDDLSQTTVSDGDLGNIPDLLNRLATFPVGYHNRMWPPVGETFGLSQRADLEASATSSYHKALERLLRSRLVLRLERQIGDNIDNPNFLYEALKVYLMLVGSPDVPKVDDKLIIAWMQRDWEESVLPGAANAGVRKQLLQNLADMLELGATRPATLQPHADLVAAARQTLRRLSLAERAYALLKSQSLAAPIDDWSLVDKGGPDTSLVFETVDGSDIGQLQVPRLFTYSGFHDYFLTEMADVGQSILDDQWVVGDYGEQQAVFDRQKNRLGRDILDIYGKEFIAAWQAVLQNLRLRSLTADKPLYQTLNAVSSVTSPLRSLVESVSQETKLNVERPVPADITGEAKAALEEQALSRVYGLKRIGLDLALKAKSNLRAGASGEPVYVPGADIQAYFDPFHRLVDGDIGQRPIDVLISNLKDVNNMMMTAANAPASQAALAAGNLQTQVGGLRQTAPKLPEPLKSMINSAAREFEGDATRTSINDLNQALTRDVTQACRRVEKLYPFNSSSGGEISFAEFARLFGPNGAFDQFFNEHLAVFADLSGKDWAWRSDDPIASQLSPKAIRQFQQASEIRDAFFSGGSQTPAVPLVISAGKMSDDINMAVLTVDGLQAIAMHLNNAPTNVIWPAPGSNNVAGVHLEPQLPGRTNDVFARQGPWAFMRLVQSARVSQVTASDMVVRFIVGGRQVSYRVNVGSSVNPFTLRALKTFSCPTGF
ncbi:type VI secretion protein IcmF [Hartmannibacter diazotrophicus]|uniref:Type VI secretion protein IcmF n=1 Tax=Hartmannibacter diazotrophicus TaxID=1482074 RepID=A0A2C9D6G1_9HYPH|nr:type VI secretion system membrane subunit TssM [Hartmannibacter diazotrophicus]SON55886.1 type VI secretion protein IcmF [Hartmannibacter diazotrophicus]